MSQKWSTAIFEELMDNAGGDRWQRHKEERLAAGEAPVIPVWKTKEFTPSAPAPGKTGAAAVLP